MISLVVASLLATNATALAVRNGSVSGQVKDSNGLPVAGRVVTLQPELSGAKTGKERGKQPTRRTTTDRMGNFRFDDVPPGKYLIVMGDKRSGWIAIPIVVEAGRETKVPDGIKQQSRGRSCRTRDSAQVLRADRSRTSRNIRDRSAVGVGRL